MVFLFVELSMDLLELLLDFFCETTHVYASKTESRNSVDFFLKFRQFYVLNCFVSNSFITGGYLDYVHP